MAVLSLDLISEDRGKFQCADVVFVHGLGGDGYTTWQAQTEAQEYWPAILAEDAPDVCVWTLTYPAELSEWTANIDALPLQDRAVSVLDELANNNVGARPLVFISHSLGGLLVKQILQTAYAHPTAPWHQVVISTKGVVFLATPHNGSVLATLISSLKILRPSVAIRDVKAESPLLRELSAWYRSNALELGISTAAYWETKPVTKSVMVVEPSNADPGISGCIPVPVDGDHFSICKLTSKNVPLYRSVLRFLSGCLGRRNRQSLSQMWMNGSPPIRHLYGRDELLAIATKVLDEGYGVVGLVGVGGVGKTQLAVSIVANEEERFNSGIWCSLRERPSVLSVLRNCISEITSSEELSLPTTIEEALTILDVLLRHHRVLVVFDNLESVITNEITGTALLPSHSDLEKVFRLFSDPSHASSLIFTSRDPVDLCHHLPSYKHIIIEGLNTVFGRQMISEGNGAELRGTDEEWRILVNDVDGVPYFLNVLRDSVALYPYNGSIEYYLRDHKSLGRSVNALLDEQFDRLAPEEKTVIYWLSIKREPMPWTEIRDSTLGVVPLVMLTNAIASLVGKGIVSSDGWNYHLPNVALEHATNRFIQEVSTELDNGNNNLLKLFSLMQASSRVDVRDAQRRLILAPIANILRLSHPSELSLIDKFDDWVDEARIHPAKTPYLVANIINIIHYLGGSIDSHNYSLTNVLGVDFSDIIVRNTSFRGCNLSGSMFANAFGGVLSVALDTYGSMIAIGTTCSDVLLSDISSTSPAHRLQGHRGWIWSVCFGTIQGCISLVSGSEDCSARIWDVRDRECVRILVGHSGRVRAVSVSPNGRFIATGSDDGVVLVWDAIGGSLLANLQIPPMVRSLVFSPDSSRLVASSESGVLCLWRINRDSVDHESTIQIGNSVLSVAFNNTGSQFATARSDGMVHIYDSERDPVGGPIQILSGHRGPVRAVCALSGGIAGWVTGGVDCTVRVWDDRGNHARLIGHTDWVYSVSSSSGLIASGSADKSVRIWDSDEYKCRNIIRGRINPIWRVVFDVNDQYCYSGSEDGVLRVWDLSRQILLREIVGHSNQIRALAARPGTRVCATGSRDNEIRLWDVDTGKLVNRLHGHVAPVWDLHFVPRSNLLASASEDGTVRLWDVITGACIDVLEGHGDRVRSVVGDGLGKYLMTGGRDQRILIWDLSTRRVISELKIPGRSLWTMDLSIDGSILVCGDDDGTIYVWKSSGKGIDIVQDKVSSAKMIGGRGGPIRSVVISPDNQYIAAASRDGFVRVWRVEGDAEPYREFGGIAPLQGCGFNSTGDRLVAGGENSILSIWSINTGRCLLELPCPRPYEGTDIRDTRGLSDTQLHALSALGALT